MTLGCQLWAFSPAASRSDGRMVRHRRGIGHNKSTVDAQTQHSLVVALDWGKKRRI
jgi:hypothetical protein